MEIPGHLSSSSDDDDIMSSNAEAEPSSAPPSFNNFSFSFIKRPLLERLNMSGPPPAPNQDNDSTTTALSNTSDPLAPEASSLNTSPNSTVNPLSVSSPDASSQRNDGFVLPGASPHPDVPNTRPSPSRSPSHVAMDIDERADSETVELSNAQPTPNGSRILGAYRNLPATHYFVAPPAALPYPQSPVRQFPEGHTLHTQPSLFAHLPRAPPRSPRLDPLAILELESERERSEWEQVCKDLGRPSLEASPAVGSAEAAPPTSLGTTTLAHDGAGIPDNDPTPTEDTYYDSDSSDVELRIYNADADDEIQAPGDSAAGTTRHTPVPLGARPLNVNGQVTTTTSRITTRPSSPSRRFPKSSSPMYQPTFTAGGEGTATPSGDQRGNSPRSGTTTPAKRKFDAMDQLAQGSSNNGTSSAAAQNTVPAKLPQDRAGIPPPLRAEVDRIPVRQSSSPTPLATSNPALVEQVASRSSSVSVSRSEKPSASQSNSTAPASSTTATDTDNRPLCKFYNRPPGRVCVRKDSCPDRHEGPLQTSVSPLEYFLSSTPTPTAPLTPSESPAPPAPVDPQPKVIAPVAVAAPTAVVATPPATIAKPPATVAQPLATVARPLAAVATPPVAVAKPLATVAKPPVTVATPPATVAKPLATLAAPSVAVATPAVDPSTATVVLPPATAAAPPTNVPASKPAAPTTRPPSRTERREPPRCRYESKPGGCTREKCPFKHLTSDKAKSGSTTETQVKPATSSQTGRAGTGKVQSQPAAPSSVQVSTSRQTTNGPVAQTQQGGPLTTLKHPLPAKPQASPPASTPQALHATGGQPFGRISQSPPKAEARPLPLGQAGPPSPTKKKSNPPTIIKIKVEQPSPGPKPVRSAPAPQPKARPTTQVASLSREIKQEDVTLYDLADDRGQADEEMADNTGGAQLNTVSVLPPSLTAPAQPPRASVPVAPPTAQPTISANSLPSSRAQAPSSQAPTAIPAPASLIPATAVIPPTPVRPPVVGQNAVSGAPAASFADRLSIPMPSRTKPSPPMPTYSNLPPISQSSQPEQPREPIRPAPERRELLSRLQDRPPSQQRRNGTDAYRPAYDDQSRPRRSPTRSRSPRSRGQSPRVRTRSPSPVRGRNVGITRYRAYSPTRRSPSPDQQRLYDRIGVSGRYSGPPERRRSPSLSRSPSPTRYGNRGYSPMGRSPPSRGSPPRDVRHHWSPPSSRSHSRSISPYPGSRPRPSYDDREYNYYGTAAPLPRTRSPSPRRNLGPESRDGYTNGSAYFPAEMHIPRPWEATTSRPLASVTAPRPGEPAGGNRNMQVERYPYTSNTPTAIENTSRPNGPSTAVGPPLASSTPGPRQPPSYAPGNPMAALNDYNSFDQTQTMEMSSPPLSPIHQYRPQDRLQDRINPPPMQQAPPNKGLLARMGNEMEQPPLVERMVPNRPPSNKAPQKGSTSSASRAQRAPRPAAGSGERAPPPLAQRLASERNSHPDYQVRMEPMSAPPRNSDRRGGALMARMVGEKTG